MRLSIVLHGEIVHVVINEMKIIKKLLSKFFGQIDKLLH